MNDTGFVLLVRTEQAKRIADEDDYGFNTPHMIKLFINFF